MPAGRHERMARGSYVDGKPSLSKKARLRLGLAAVDVI